MISLVGLTGPAQHGKDTVGKMLLKRMPAAQRFAFADKIKEFLVEAFEYGESIEQNKEGSVLFMTSWGAIQTAMLNTLHEGVMMYGVDVEKAVFDFIRILKEHHGNFMELRDGRILFTSSWRKMCQITGTEFGRQNLAPDFWVTPWLPKENTVVTDVRGYGDSLKNLNLEAQAIIERGGVVVRVVDPRKGAVVRGHASEAGIEDEYVAHTIINDGSLEELEDKVCAFLYLYLLNGEC